MLAEPFNHTIIRKMVVLFGNLFNNIWIVRKKSDGTELERVKVVLAYAPKEKFISRLLSDPNLTKSIMVNLPRMSFEIKEFTYDPSRKQTSVTRHSAINENDSSKRWAQYVGVPYNFNFLLSIYTRNIDDANQIVEQILPYFTPDFCLTATFVEEMGIKKDVPFILNSVESNIEYEGQAQATPRLVTWDLNFTAKGWFFGPVANTAIIKGIQSGNSITGGITTQIYQMDKDSELQHLSVSKITSHGFIEGEYITVDARNITGKTLAWSNTNNKLVVTPTGRNIEAGDIVRGTASHAYATVTAVRFERLELANIHIYQNPITATANDDYGYTTHITEYPDTIS